jgi:hypothetical protein
MTNEIESKCQQAAKEYFDSYEFVQEVAVILKGEPTSWIAIHRRGKGQLSCIDFPGTYDLEYAAQCWLRRFDVVRAEVVYA